MGSRAAITPRSVHRKDAGELRVQHGEQGRAILPVEGQKDFAVAAALEGVALFFQGGPHGLKPYSSPLHTA